MRVAPALPFVLVAGIAIAACNDSQPGTPTSPEFAAGGLAPSKSGCDTKQLAKDVDAAWAPNTATNGTVSTLVKALASALQNPPDSVTATAKGFEILDAVAQAVVAAPPAPPTTTAALASPVAVDVLKCMVLGVSQASLPTSFVDALGPHGAFAVRGKSSDSRPVVSHDSIWSIEPVSPPNDWRTVEGNRSGTFSNANYTSATNTALRDSVRALFLAYGMPDSTLNANITNFTRDQSVSPVFDWFTLPREVFLTTNGSPGVQITQCGATQGFLQHYAVSTDSQVVLASFDVAVCPTGPLAGLSPLTPRSLAQKVWHFFAPEPAYAFGSGSGSKGSNLSPWGVVNPGYVNLVFTQKVDKSNNQVGDSLFDTSKPPKPLQVTAFSKAGSPFKQGSIFTWIEAINNQGVNVQVCKNWAYTDTNGVATFTHAYLNKAGGYTLRFRTVGTKVNTPGGSSAGNTPIPVGEGPNPPLSNLFNVKNGTADSADCTGNNIYITGQDTLPSIPGRLSP